jgi:hypothetical protein
LGHSLSIYRWKIPVLIITQPKAIKLSQHDSLVTKSDSM